MFATHTLLVEAFRGASRTKERGFTMSALELFILVCVLGIIAGKAFKNWEEKQMQEKNPDLWIKMREAEERKKERRRDSAVSNGLKIASWWFRK